MYPKHIHMTKPAMNPLQIINYADLDRAVLYITSALYHNYLTELLLSSALIVGPSHITMVIRSG